MTSAPQISTDPAEAGGLGRGENNGAIKQETVFFGKEQKYRKRCLL
jgi:hypothetical protein